MRKKAKKQTFLQGIESGLKKTGKAIGLSAKGVFYSETPQVKGRIGRAYAHDTKGGRGKIAKRGSFVDDMLGIKQKRRQDRGKIVRALAKNTKGGKGRIAKRPAYKQHLPK